ncbi:MAG: heme ABC transporter ATP-binding protein [Myxococcota bacterium]|nr:heme ABC transporter ATP-binding protein [Myxococcota bacterium]
MSLEARSVTVHRGGLAVVHEVSLAVDAGERLAIIGPNGAGKSTLLHCLSGALAPASGEVLLDGLALSSWKPRALARQRAMLAQAGSLTFPFTLAEVVGMGRAPHGGPRLDDPAVERALERSGITDLADRPWTRLSGGERQRGRLARVLAQLDAPQAGGTRVLLLDEPTNHLDLAWKQATLGAASAMAKDGVAVIAVLHDLNQALSWADRVLLLDAGRPVCLAPAVEALQPDRVSDVYGLRVELLHPPGHRRPLLVPIEPNSIPQGLDHDGSTIAP